MQLLSTETLEHLIDQLIAMHQLGGGPGIAYADLVKAVKAESEHQDGLILSLLDTHAAVLAYLQQAPERYAVTDGLLRLLAPPALPDTIMQTLTTSVVVGAPATPHRQGSTGGSVPSGVYSATEDASAEIRLDPTKCMDTVALYLRQPGIVGTWVSQKQIVKDLTSQYAFTPGQYRSGFRGIGNSPRLARLIATWRETERDPYVYAVPGTPEPKTVTITLDKAGKADPREKVPPILHSGAGKRPADSDADDEITHCPQCKTDVYYTKGECPSCGNFTDERTAIEKGETFDPLPNGAPRMGCLESLANYQARLVQWYLDDHVKSTVLKDALWTHMQSIPAQHTDETARGSLDKADIATLTWQACWSHEQWQEVDHEGELYVDPE